MQKNSLNVLVIIMLAGILCLLLGIFAFLIIRDYLPSGTNILHVTQQKATRNPTYGLISTYTLFPTIEPTSGPEWVWSTLPLYNWKVEMPSDWTAALMNTRPEPTDPLAMGSTQLGHDCTDYQLISPDRMRFINITMFCGFSDSAGGPCSNDTVFVKAVGTDSYLVRWPSNKANGWIYQISNPGTWEDMSGTHTGYFCDSSPLPLYFYWEIGKVNYWETNPDVIIDRIMLSLLTANKYP